MLALLSLISFFQWLEKELISYFQSLTIRAWVWLLIHIKRKSENWISLEFWLQLQGAVLSPLLFQQQHCSSQHTQIQLWNQEVQLGNNLRIHNCKFSGSYCASCGQGLTVEWEVITFTLNIEGAGAEIIKTQVLKGAIILWLCHMVGNGSSPLSVQVSRHSYLHSPSPWSATEESHCICILSCLKLSVVEF